MQQLSKQLASALKQRDQLLAAVSPLQSPRQRAGNAPSLSSTSATPHAAPAGHAFAAGSVGAAYATAYPSAHSGAATGAAYGSSGAPGGAAATAHGASGAPGGAAAGEVEALRLEREALQQRLSAAMASSLEHTQRAVREAELELQVRRKIHASGTAVQPAVCIARGVHSAACLSRCVHGASHAQQVACTARSTMPSVWCLHPNGR